jgi:secreted trypsin-like serine protease
MPYFRHALFTCIVASAACSAVPDRSIEQTHDSAVGATADGGAVQTSADQVEIVKGVPNRGRDPGVIAINIANEALCSGTLISPRLVLTARHCVSNTAESLACPATSAQVFSDRRASDLSILVGDDISSAKTVARGQSLLTPGGATLCDNDIAIIVLDTDVDLVKPVPVGTHGPAKGTRVRSVGFGKSGDDDPAGKKLLREHVPVLAVTAAEFEVGESTCNGDSGGPALDEDTGEILGVVSRGGPTCEGGDVRNIYTRVDAFSWLIDQAFAKVTGGSDEPADAGASSAKPPKRGTKSKPPSDVGSACQTAKDCAAGICMEESDGTQYCSRPCGSGDRCPAHFHCTAVDGLPSGTSACAAVE